MAEDKNIHYSRRVVALITIGVAVLSVFMYSSGLLGRCELITLDYRFLLNRAAPSYSISRALPAKSTETKFPAGKEAAARDYSAFNVVLIDMPEVASNPEGGPDIKDCITATKILTLWNAKSIIFADLLPAPTGTADDADLIDTITLSKRVYLPVLYGINDRGDISGVKEPWQSLKGKGAMIGHINASLDTDERLRKVPIAMTYKGRTTYQLGLKAALDALSVKAKDVRIDPVAHTIKIDMPSGDSMVVPLEDDNRLMINWGLATEGRFPVVPFRELLESYRLIQYGARPLVMPEAFKGKICILSTAASNKISNRPQIFKSGRASSAACAVVADSVMRRDFVHYLPGGFNIAIILCISILFGLTLTYAGFLRVMMIVVIAVILLYATNILWLPKNMALAIVIILSVPLGVLLSASQVFSGLIFTVLSVIGYLAVSTGVFRATKVALPTSYTVFAIFAIFTGFYLYVRLIGYLGTMRLFNLASKDGLTGLVNRRYLNLMLDSELNSVVLDKSRKLTLVMCDIDNFKKLNDTYGHQAGDLILKKFAAIMKSKCRQADIVARYGGEEFVMIFPGAVAKEALKIAEAIRQAISEETFTFKGESYSTSMSMGLAEYSHERSKEELIEKADQALYRAKNEGKNRVCM